MTQSEFKAIPSTAIGKKVTYKQYVPSIDRYKVTTGIVDGFGQICNDGSLVVRNYGMRHVVHFAYIIRID